MIFFFKDLYQTLFRWIRFPCETGIFEVGKPSRFAPLLVTCNFDYTVRHLRRYLEEKQIDCFLLVVNSNGTNVWCAASEGVFTTERVLIQLKAYQVHKILEHRRLILPFLSARGMKRKNFEENGWEAVYGPIHFRDIDKFLVNGCQLTKDMKSLEYPMWERFKMGLSHSTFCTLILFIPIMILASHWRILAFCLIWYFCLFMQLFQGYLFFERLLYQGLILSVPALTLCMVLVTGNFSERLRAAVVVFFMASFIGFDAQGHSYLAQNQHSGKILAVLLLLCILIYGGTFL